MHRRSSQLFPQGKKYMRHSYMVAHMHATSMAMTESEKGLHAGQTSHLCQVKKC